jgi:hypothetical protein
MGTPAAKVSKHLNQQRARIRGYYDLLIRR